MSLDPPSRLNSHRIRLLPFDYNVVYEPGKTTPCDYGSRHPSKQEFTEAEIEEWCIDEGRDIYVNRLLEESLPQALRLEDLKSHTANDSDLQKLLVFVRTRDERSCRKKLPEFHGIFKELSEIDGLVVRGHQIVVPKTLQADSIGLAHEGHQFCDKTLQLLRQTCWFPRMHQAVENYISSCLACNASSSHNDTVPLEPNFLPDRPWQMLHADFKGPIGNSYYLHIIIDQFSKYPEVDIVTSTSFKKLRPILDRVMATHGIPESVTSDNGPPYPGDEMEQYAAEKGFALTPVSPNDPQGNGFAENFVKQMCKMVHTSVVEGKDPKQELYNYLLQYRATPHTSTGLSPAEMLFGRKIQTKLPQIFVKEEPDHIKKARKKHDENKMIQKKHFDKKKRAKSKEVKIGDKVLIRQRKTTVNPPFDPKPFTVTGVENNAVSMNRQDGASRLRDKNQIKVLKKRPKHLIPSWQRGNNAPATDYRNLEIEGKNDTSNDSVSDASVDRDHNNLFQLDQAMEARMQALLEPIAEESEEADQEALFALDDNVEARMQALLEAASGARDTADPEPTAPGRVTRSHGRNLQWNSVMNDKNVIVEGDQ